MMKVQTEMTVVLNVIIQRTKRPALCAMNIVVLTVISQPIKSIVKIKKQCPNCPLTGEAFKLVKNFECHTELCNGEGTFKCPHCDRVFPQYDTARYHKY